MWYDKLIQNNSLKQLYRGNRQIHRVLKKNGAGL